jgi:predicted Zn-dependent protease
MNKLSLSTVICGALLAATSVMIVDASSAEACGGAVWRENVQRTVKPAPPILVAKAEKAFDEGKTEVALKTALEAYPQLAKATPSKDPIANRAIRLAALASVRSGGAQSVVGAKGPVSYVDYDYGKEVNIGAKLLPAKSDEERASRMVSALKALRALHDQSPDNVTMEGDLGEALAAVPGNEEEALEVLSKLADKDLLGSPQAYSALARLRFQQGLVKKSVEAMQRCNAMAGGADICGPAIPGTAS